MNEITAKSLKNKYLFIVLIKAILYYVSINIIRIFILQKLINNSIISTIIYTIFSLLGIKIVFIDTLRKLTKKYLLQPDESNLIIKQFKKIHIVFIGLGIIISSQIFVHTIAYIKTVLTFSGFINITDEQLLAVTRIPGIISAASPTILAIIAYFTVIQNSKRIFNNESLCITPLIIILIIGVFASNIFSITVDWSDLIINNLILENSDEVNESTENLESDFTPIHPDTISQKDYIDTLETYGQHYAILNDNCMFNLNDTTNSIYQFDNLNFENGKKVYESEDLIYKDIPVERFLYATDKFLYYYPTSIIGSLSQGLYKLDLSTGEKTRLTYDVLAYNSASKPVDYFDYVISASNIYGLYKMNYSDETAKNIITFQVPEGGNFDIEPYKDFYITTITDNISSSILYKNNEKIYETDSIINYTLVAKDQLHIFANNMIYNLNIETGEVISSAPTPFNTSDINEHKISYDPELTDINKFITVNDTIYEVDVTTNTFNPVDLPSSDFAPQYDYILNLDENHVIAYFYDKLPSILEKGTWKIVKDYSKDNSITTFILGFNSNYYLVDKEFNITKITADIIN